MGGVLSLFAQNHFPSSFVKESSSPIENSPSLSFRSLSEAVSQEAFLRGGHLTQVSPISLSGLGMLK